MKLLMSLIVLCASAGFAQSSTTETTTTDTPQGETVTTTEQVTDNESDDNKGSLILSVAGVVNNRIKEGQNESEDKSMDYGGGALVEFGLNDNLGLETGALVINRQYERGGSNLKVIQEVKRLHVPLLVRFWPVDFISIGAGGFTSFKLGDVKNSLEIGGTEVGSLTTKADDSVEYGLEAAVALNLAVSDKTGIFVEGRYSDLLSGDKNTDYNEVSGLAGIKIDL